MNLGLSTFSFESSDEQIEVCSYRIFEHNLEYNFTIILEKVHFGQLSILIFSAV